MLFFAVLLSPALDGFKWLLSLGTVHYLSSAAVIESHNSERKKKNRTRAAWARSVNPTSVLWRPAQQHSLFTFVVEKFPGYLNYYSKATTTIYDPVITSEVGGNFSLASMEAGKSLLDTSPGRMPPPKNFGAPLDIDVLFSKEVFSVLQCLEISVEEL